MRDGMDTMRIVAPEEHVAFPQFVQSDDKMKFAHGNADALLTLHARVS